MDYFLRVATFEDMDAILELWGAMMAEHEQSDPRIRLARGAMAAYRSYAGYHMASTESHLQVAEAAGRVVGFSLMAVSRNLPMFLPARYGYLSDLTVSADWRRRGVGRALVRDAIGWLRAQEIDTIQLQYYTFNANGEAFWKAMGFHAYYTRMWHDIA